MDPPLPVGEWPIGPPVLGRTTWRHPPPGTAPRPGALRLVNSGPNGSPAVPPSGSGGSGIGRETGLVQRIAEGAVKSFVERVAARVAVVGVGEQSNGAGRPLHQLQRI
jgi:hypothetical protein